VQIKRARDRIEGEVAPQLKAEQEKVANEEESLKAMQEELGGPHTVLVCVFDLEN
jgi:hypothetical protein